jgi:hypothetical protein
LLAFDGVGDKVIIMVAPNFSAGVGSLGKGWAPVLAMGFLMMRTSTSKFVGVLACEIRLQVVGIYNRTNYFGDLNVGTISANAWYHVTLVLSVSNTSVLCVADREVHWW